MDIFKRLSFGTLFSKSALKREKIKSAKTTKQTPKVDKNEERDLEMELDFFKTSKSQENNNTSAKSLTKRSKILKPSKRVLFENETEMHAFRKKNCIKVYGEDVPLPIKSFKDFCRPEFNVPMEIIESILEAGLKKPTSVQLQASTVLLFGRDAFVVAPTGSGKTLVFVISILSKLLKAPKSNTINAIVVSPTRELAHQIREEFRRFTPKDPSGKYLLSTVLLNKAVLNSWKSKPPTNFPSILVTTPKRLVNGIEDKTVDLSNVRQIILDEADRLLELGLMEQMDDILSACTFKDGPILKALFSATIPTGVEELARSFMNDDPIRVVIGQPNAANTKIDQKLIYVGQEEGKLMAIRQMLVQGLEPPVIIFTETIERAQGLFHELVSHGINVDMIHSSRSQTERENIIRQFRNGRIWFLITTELLARGLDFPEVSCVINYDFPLSTASYIHRIGRTGRAGKRGKAITLFTSEDSDALKIVANVMIQSGCEIPEWILNLQRKSTKKLLKDRLRKRDHTEIEYYE